MEQLLARGRAFTDLRRGDLAAARDLIPDGLIDQLAILGDAATVGDRLRRLQTIGVTHVSIAPPAEPTSAKAWSDLIASLEHAG